LYIDLIDDFNELGVNFFPQHMGTINDQDSGYSLENIEGQILKHVYGLSSLNSELKADKPSGVNDAQIDLLLNNY
jgi:hypothetical protein